MGVLSLFVYLQVLDLLTTILFLRLGLSETSLVVGALIRWSPLVGVMVAKLAAILVGVIAAHLHKERVMRLANVGYGGVVAWNLLCMILARPA